MKEINIKGKYIAFLPEGIELYEDFEKKVSDAFENNENIAMVYTDYEIVTPTETRKVNLFDYNNDVTERFDFGPIQVYRKDLWDKFYHTKYTDLTSISYNFMLHMLEQGYRFYHLHDVLYRYYVKKETEAIWQAFKYLRYSKELEKEIEDVFENFLKRQSAYIDHKNKPIIYSPEEKFSPLVSIVVPVKDRAKWLPKTISSVLNQTFTDFELIFVDNFSSDETPWIIESYSRKDKRIKLIRLDKEHPGLIAGCLNIGLKNAKGKYYAQLDSDDEYTPHTLEEMVKYLESNPNVALAISYYYCIDEDSREIKEAGIIKHLEFNRNNILRCEGAGAVRVWHIKVMKEFNFFDEEYGAYGEDYDLLLKASELYDIGRVHKVLYKYRRHSGVTDVIRDKKVKLENKVKARLIAIERRKKLNQLLAKYNTDSIADIPAPEIKKVYET